MKSGQLEVKRTRNTVTLRWKFVDEYEAMFFYDMFTKKLASGDSTINISTEMRYFGTAERPKDTMRNVKVKL